MYVIREGEEAPCQPRYRLWWTIDPLCSGRLPNSVTSSQVPSPVRPDAVAVPLAIALNPMTPDTALIFRSDDRSTLLRQIAELGDFQPGSITSATRRCGSSACHCAKPNDPGHGPHFQLTQKVDGKTVTQNLPSLVAVRKAESEIAEFRKFQTLTGELVDVNRKICRLRPVEQTEQTTQEKKRPKRSKRKSPSK